MKENALKEAASLADRGLVLVATMDDSETPHIAAAGDISLLGDASIGVTDWFCPGTVANARPGRAVSVVVWAPQDDDGRQLIGKVNRLEDVAVLDGYAPEREQETIPQVERKLVVDVEQVLRFRKAPHSDQEE
jgi:hypothetical protein